LYEIGGSRPRQSYSPNLARHQVRRRHYSASSSPSRSRNPSGRSRNASSTASSIPQAFIGAKKFSYLHGLDQVRHIHTHLMPICHVNILVMKRAQIRRTLSQDALSGGGGSRKLTPPAAAASPWRSPPAGPTATSSPSLRSASAPSHLRPVHHSGSRSLSPQSPLSSSNLVQNADQIRVGRERTQVRRPSEKEMFTTVNMKHITRNLCYIISEFGRFSCRWRCPQGRAEQFITFFLYAV
jgi:hypothetical protein